MNTVSVLYFDWDTGASVGCPHSNVSLARLGESVAAVTRLRNRWTGTTWKTVRPQVYAVVVPHPSLLSHVGGQSYSWDGTIGGVNVWHELGVLYTDYLRRVTQFYRVPLPGGGFTHRPADAEFRAL